MATFLVTASRMTITTAEDVGKVVTMWVKAIEDRPELAERMGRLLRRALTNPSPKRDRAAYMREWRAKVAARPKPVKAKPKASYVDPMDSW